MKKTYLYLVVLVLITAVIIWAIFKKTTKKTTSSSPQPTAVAQKITVSPTPRNDEKYYTFSPEDSSVPVASSFSLTVSQPQDKTTVNSSALQIKGSTAAGASVFINDKELKADSNGQFSTSLNLDEGDNIIDVLAHDANGNFSEKELTVTLETAQ